METNLESVAGVWGSSEKVENVVRNCVEVGGQGKRVCKPVDPRVTDISNVSIETRHVKSFFKRRQLKLTIPTAHKPNKNIVKRNQNYVQSSTPISFSAPQGK